MILALDSSSSLSFFSNCGICGAATKNFQEQYKTETFSNLSVEDKSKV